MPLPKKAIMREIPDTYKSCLSVHPDHNSVNVDRVRKQHENYQNILKELGIEVILLPKENKYPDSCFVEDTAIVHGSNAVITRLARNERQGEELSVAKILSEYKTITYIKEPSTIEGGDVIHLDNYLIAGLTSRTNKDGISTASKLLNTEIKIIEANDIMHLKSYVTYLGNNIMVTTERFKNNPTITNFDKIVVDPKETYAANTLSFGDVVLVSSGFPKLREDIIDHGFEVINLDMSEFEKCDGAITCLSILLY